MSTSNVNQAETTIDTTTLPSLMISANYRTGQGSTKSQTIAFAEPTTINIGRKIQYNWANVNIDKLRQFLNEAHENGYDEIRLEVHPCEQKTDRVVNATKKGAEVTQ